MATIAISVHLLKKFGCRIARHSTAVDTTPIGEKNVHFKRKTDVRVKNAFIIHEISYQNNTQGKR
jgi:hypothetical protein